MKSLFRSALLALLALSLGAPAPAQTIANPTQAGVCYTLWHSAVPVTHANDTAEFAYATVSVPGRAVGPNGRVQIITVWSMTGSTNLKTFRTKWAGTIINAIPISTATAIALQLLTRLANRNSLTSQVSQPAAAPGFNSSTSGVVVTTADTNSAQPIVIAAQMASGAESLTLEDAEIVVCPGA